MVIGAQAGTFLADGIALMVNVGADWSKPVDEYTLGTGMRFYFNSTGVYLGGGLDWNRFRWSGGHHQTDWGLGIEAGYAYFLSRTVTIEPAVYYKCASTIATCHVSALRSDSDSTFNNG